MQPAAVSVHSPHSLLPLFPQFLRKRRRGFGGVPAFLAETGLSRPAFFMLVRVAEGPPEGSTAEELRPGAPYATRDPHLPWLAEDVGRGLLVPDDRERHRLTADGRAVVERLERAGSAYLAALQPIPPGELARLADRFAAIAAGLDAEAARPEAHLHRSRRIAALRSGAEDAPLVRLERTVFDLWMARDDAHMGAWRAARFPGPAFDVLTRLWQGDAETLSALHDALAATQDPADVDAALDELIEQGYVEWRGDTLRPTRAGYRIREEVEAATDELYFGQWPPLDSEEVAWLHDALQRVIAGLPDAPPE